MMGQCPDESAWPVVTEALPGEGPRILVRSTNWIGDVVMTLPALEALRELYPGGRITVLARPWVRAILDSHPAVDHVLEYGKGRGPLRGILPVFEAARRVRRLHFDMAVLFQNAFEAALIARLAGIPIRVGYDTDARRCLLTHPVSRSKAPRGVHQVEYYLEILRSMGWTGETRSPRIRMAESDRAKALELLDHHGIRPEEPILGVAPGAAFGPAKRWPADRFARVADRAVREWNARVLILGSAVDAEACRAVESAMVAGKPINLCARTTLGEAIALISTCRAFLTNDSGLMHVSSALDVPTVAVFGSTDPVATGPGGTRSRVVQNPVECAPCLRPVCSRDYRCMLGITPDAVWDAVKEVLRC